MSAGTQISQLQTAQSIPDGSKFITEMGDGSGTKVVTKEVLTQAVGEDLKIGDLENLQTTNKASIVAAINEATQSGGGSAVDILDSKEEIEANTEEGKVAGALAVQEMFSEINSKLNELYDFVQANREPVALIPKMKSNTESVSGEDCGTVIYDSFRSAYYPWYVFDGAIGNSGESWTPNKTPSSAGEIYVGYVFDAPKTVKKITVYNAANTGRGIKDMLFQASNDGSGWINLTPITLNNVASAAQNFDISNNDAYTHYRLLAQTYYASSATEPSLDEVQMYGF